MEILKVRLLKKKVKLMNSNNEKLDTDEIEFEKAVGKLEDIVEKLESGELSLSESLDNFTKGVELIKYCRKELNEAEEKVEKVLKESDGKFADVVAFEDKEE